MSIEENKVFKSVALGIVYGMMLSLGLRNTLSKEEKEFIAKYNQ